MSQSVASRMRRQTRRAVRSSNIRAQSPLSTSFILDTDNGNAVWFVEDVRYPKEVGAGGAVDVGVDLVNRRQFITPLHPDQCTSGFFNGLKSEITITPNWDADEFSTTNCLGIGDVGVKRETISADFPAPSEPGTYTFSVEVRAPGSGNGGIESFEIVVPESGGDQRPGNGDEGGENGDENDDDEGGPLNQTTIFGIVAIIAAVAGLAFS